MATMMARRSVNCPGHGQHDGGSADMAKRTCSIEWCDRPARTRGWCANHYTHWWRHGDPLGASRVHGDDRRRLERHIDKTGDCWIWTGAKLNGYGHCRFDGRPQCAHRAVWQMEVGPIPDGLELDHLCRVRACVNPAHLEPVTRAENIARVERDANGRWVGP